MSTESTTTAEDAAGMLAATQIRAASIARAIRGVRAMMPDHQTQFVRLLDRIESEVRDLAGVEEVEAT